MLADCRKLKGVFSEVFLSHVAIDSVVKIEGVGEDALRFRGDAYGR
jgi:hypothetical protein